MKVTALNRILKRLSTEILLLENNDLLSLSDSEIHNLKNEFYDDYFLKKTRLKEAKQEYFFLEMQIIKINNNL